MSDDTDRKWIAVGVDELAAFNFACGIAHVFIAHALIATEVEAFLDGLRIEAQHFFDAERHLIGPELALQSRFLSKERIGPIGSNHNRSIELAILAAAEYANDPSIFVKQVVDNRRGNEERSCFFCFAG